MQVKTFYVTKCTYHCQASQVFWENYIYTTAVITSKSNKTLLCLHRGVEHLINKEIDEQYLKQCTYFQKEEEQWQ